MRRVLICLHGVRMWVGGGRVVIVLRVRWRRRCCVGGDRGGRWRASRAGAYRRWGSAWRHGAARGARDAHASVFVVKKCPGG